jgi:hypothetical protein
MCPELSKCPELSMCSELSMCPELVEGRILQRFDRRRPEPVEGLSAHAPASRSQGCKPVDDGCRDCGRILLMRQVAHSRQADQIVPRVHPFLGCRHCR